jgi:predicted cobalt transporter CbtA
MNMTTVEPTIPCCQAKQIDYADIFWIALVVIAAVGWAITAGRARSLGHWEVL